MRRICPVQQFSPAVLLALALAWCPGCVERLLEIRSDPPGAEVYINGERAGVTPLDHRFDFYGTFDITLRSKEHRSCRNLETVRPPWYEIPPLDFFAENLVPFVIRDRNEFHYTLEPIAEIQEMEREAAEIQKRIQSLEEKLKPSTWNPGES